MVATLRTATGKIASCSSRVVAQTATGCAAAAAGAACRGIGASGSRTVNVVPRPSAGAASIVRPWRAMTLCRNIAATELLGWSFILQAREAAAQRTGSDELRRTNVDLQGRVQNRAADAAASGERLRSIIDSAAIETRG
jgi:C4-dicarboxylate-specific signal transduction histidine kinase